MGTPTCGHYFPSKLQRQAPNLPPCHSGFPNFSVAHTLLNMRNMRVFLFFFFFINNGFQALPKTTKSGSTTEGLANLHFPKYSWMIALIRQMQFTHYSWLTEFTAPDQKLPMAPTAGKIKSKFPPSHLRPSTIQSTHILPVSSPIITSHVLCAQSTLWHVGTFSAFFHHHVFHHIVPWIWTILYPCLSVQTPAILQSWS